MSGPEWSFIPTDLLDFEKRQKEAKAWADQQRTALASHWADVQRQIDALSEPVQKASQFLAEAPGRAARTPLDVADWEYQHVAKPYGGEVLGIVNSAYEDLGQKFGESATKIGDIINSASPGHQAAMPTFENRMPYSQDVEQRVRETGPMTGILPEGPVRGAAGILGQVVHDAATGQGPVPIPGQEQDWVNQTPERKAQLAADWARWQKESHNPVLEALNPVGFLGPERLGLGLGEVARAAKAAAWEAGPVLGAVREGLPEVGQVAKRLATEERGALRLPGGGNDRAKSVEHPLIQKAKEEFGTTYDPREAGYLTPTGEFLDFSGKREGGPSGVRYQDHREINAIFDDEQGSDALGSGMIAFMGQTGSVRWSLLGGRNGELMIDLAAPPTTAQIQRILRQADTSRVWLDVTDPKTGNTLLSEELASGDVRGLRRLLNQAKTLLAEGNAESGAVNIGQALDLGGTALGAGASYDPNATPEENAARMAAGGLVGYGLARGARTRRMGLGIEDVSKGKFTKDPATWPGRETTFRVQLSEKELAAIKLAKEQQNGKAVDKVRHAAERRAEADFEKRYATLHGQYPGYSDVPKFFAVDSGGVVPKEYPWRQSGKVSDTATTSPPAPTAKPAEAVPAAEPPIVLPPATGTAQQQFPIISDYLNGNIGVRWQQYKDELINADAKLTPAKAGDLAAARIFKEYGPETDNLERAIKSSNDDALLDLYDQWVAASDKSTIQNDLVDLSGTRTLVADLDRVPDTVARPLNVQQPPTVPPSVPAEATPPQGAKAPWEMTQAEFGQATKERYLRSGQPDYYYAGVTDEARDRAVKWHDDVARLSKGVSGRHALAKGSVQAQHETIIRNALAEGLPVPREVLDEYPNLVSKAPTQPLEKPTSPSLGRTETAPQASIAPEGVIPSPEPIEPLDALTHAKGVRAAADIGGVLAVGAKNLKVADKTLEAAGERPANITVSSISKSYLKDLYENKKPPVVGDTFTDKKSGFRIEITKVSDTPTPTGAYAITYQTFPTKGKGRISDIYLDKKYAPPSESTARAPEKASAPVKAVPEAVTPTAQTGQPAEMLLPRDLQGAKPRYKSQIVNFEQDVDKALYIVGNTSQLSKRDADYMAFLRKQFPDRSDKELREMGQLVRSATGKKAGEAGTQAEVTVLHKDIQGMLTTRNKNLAAKGEQARQVPDWVTEGAVAPSPVTPPRQSRAPRSTPQQAPTQVAPSQPQASPPSTPNPPGGGTIPPPGGTTPKPPSPPPPPPPAPTLPMPREPQTAGFQQFWNRARNVIANQGTAGKKLAELLHQTREMAETTAGQWSAAMPTVRKLNRREFDNFVDVAEAQAMAISAKVQQAVGEWVQVRDAIHNAAQNAMLDIGYRPNYFPHTFNPDMFKGDKWVKAVNHLVTTGQAADPDEAAQMLRHAIEAIRNRRHGNLEIERLFDLPGYEKTRAALSRYVESAAERIAQVRVLGQNDSIAMRLINKIGSDGYDASAAKNLFDIALGAKQYGSIQKEISGALRAYNFITKMGLGALTNLGQPTNIVTVAGGIRTLLNVPKALFSQQAYHDALEMGTILDATLQKLREGGGFTGALGKLGAPGFNLVEAFNRVLAGETGMKYAADMARKAAAGSQEGIKALNTMGLNGQQIVQRGGQLSQEERTQAARNMVERTQFKVDPQDLPGWTASPWGKVLMQFRTFAYNQTAFIGREIIKPALQGDVKPLLRFLIFGLPVGATLVELQNFLRHRDSEEDPIQRVRQYYQKVGGLGVLGDLATGLSPMNSSRLDPARYATMAIGSLGGPTVSTVAEGLGAIPGAIHDKPVNMERFLLKQIPLVGTTLQNTLVPYNYSPYADVPELRRLKFMPGPVSETVGIGSRTIPLTRDERAKLETSTTSAIKDQVEKLTAMPAYRKLDDAAKEKVLKAQIAKVREQQRLLWLKTLSKDELKKRLAAGGVR